MRAVKAQAADCGLAREGRVEPYAFLKSAGQARSRAARVTPTAPCSSAASSGAPWGGLLTWSPAALWFAGNKDLDKATELIGQIDHAQRRSIVRIAIAYNLLNSRETQATSGETKVSEQRAFDLLNDVEKDLRKEDPSANAARILLGRAALLSKVDKQQTLFALQQALQVINKLDRFDLKDPTAPRLGISISPRSESLADAPRVGFSFRSAIEAIVQDEFDDVAELASSFKVKEVRGIGRLEVARLFLEKTDPSRR